jgi:hypothetical protein
LVLTGTSDQAQGPQIAEDKTEPTATVPDNQAQPQRPCAVAIIETIPGVLERHRAKPTGKVTRIDDAALVATLASINRPAGLVRIGDRVWLTAPVTDAELTVDQ